MKTLKMYASALFVAAVFFLLTFSQEARAGGVDVHIGVGLPFPGYVTGPPVVYAPPRVIVVPPGYRYHNHVVLPPYGYYRPHHSYRDDWKFKGHSGHGRHSGRHRGGR